MRVPVAPRRPLRCLLAPSGGRPSRSKHSPQLHEWKSAPQVSESERLAQWAGVIPRASSLPPNPGARGERGPGGFSSRPPPGPSSASPQTRRSSPGPLSRRNCGEGTLLKGLKFGVLQAILLFFFLESRRVCRRFCYSD